MRKRIYLSIFFTALTTMILSCTIVIGLMYSNTFTEVKKQLHTEAVYLSEALSGGTVKYLESIGEHTNNRITLIDSYGVVLYDNFANPENMDNHKDRPEVSGAIKNGSGEATRQSGTLDKQTYYYAVLLKDGNILRISGTTDNILGMAIDTLKWTIPLLVIIGIVAFWVARKISNSITSPINDLDLKNPLNNDTYDELSPLLLRLEKQNRRIDTQRTVISEKQSEFETITSGMKEGLVILDSSGKVISANTSALKIFGLGKDDTADTYLELCRDYEYTKAVESSLNGHSGSILLRKDGRCYNISASSVQSSPNSYASVLYISDVTEKEEAEEMRKEFTANVSHELKTPLTSIMGYGEIIENQLAQPQDIPAFAGKIRSEAARLLSLIEDIIELSRLDEGASQKMFSPVKLHTLAAEVLSQLEAKSAKSQVELILEAEHCEIQGIKQPLSEMIFNLCDNAISYNRPGGHVWVTVKKDGSDIVLSVKDDGIGIPPEDQPRVFERFYRVDKSHSKETGGTGLGLSIVKHSVLMHGGKISLTSEVGKGTCIEIRLFQH